MLTSQFTSTLLALVTNAVLLNAHRKKIRKKERNAHRKSQAYNVVFLSVLQDHLDLRKGITQVLRQYHLSTESVAIKKSTFVTPGDFMWLQGKG